MRLPYITVIGMALATLSGCQSDSLRISGDLTNIADGPIYLSMLDSSLSAVVIDTATVEDGHFVFDNGMKMTQPECFILSVGNQNMVVFAGNDNVSIAGNMLRPENLQVSGSHSHNDFTSYVKDIPGRDRMAQLQVLLSSVSGDVDQKDAYIDEMKSIEEEQVVYVRNFIEKHSDTPLGAYILLYNMPQFTYEEIEAMHASFSPDIQQHKYVTTLGKILREKKEQNEAQKRVQEGCPAPDFALQDEKGDTIRLSDFRGKIVLLEFWASWCNPCRTNNETIVEVHKKFSSKGLVVLGISQDTNKAKWLEAKSQDNLPGHQMIDASGEVAKAYCVEYLPFSYIIDADGIIVAKDIAGPHLFDDVAARMKN